MGTIGCLYCFDEILNFGCIRIVFYSGFLIR